MPDFFVAHDRLPSATGLRGPIKQAPLAYEAGAILS